MDERIFQERLQKALAVVKLLAKLELPTREWHEDQCDWIGSGWAQGPKPDDRRNARLRSRIRAVEMASCCKTLADLQDVCRILANRFPLPDAECFTDGYCYRTLLEIILSIANDRQIERLPVFNRGWHIFDSEKPLRRLLKAVADGLLGEECLPTRGAVFQAFDRDAKAAKAVKLIQELRAKAIADQTAQ